MCCVHNANPGKNCLDAIWSRALQGMSQSAPAVKKLRTAAPYPQFALKSFLVAQSSNAIIQEAINRLLAAQRLWIFPYLPKTRTSSLTDQTTEKCTKACPFWQKEFGDVHLPRLFTSLAEGYQAILDWSWLVWIVHYVHLCTALGWQW